MRAKHYKANEILFRSYGRIYGIGKENDIECVSAKNKVSYLVLSLFFCIIWKLSYESEIAALD